MAKETAAGIEEGLGTFAGAEAASRILDLLPDKIKNNIPLFGQLSNSIKVAGDSAAYFSGVSQDLSKNFGTVAGLFSKDFDKSLASISEKLKTQIDSYQKLDKEFIQLGKGENSKAYIESIRQQSFESAKLGISLQNLVDINKTLIKDYTGAITLTERQTQKYAENKKAITELAGFNDKFGVTTDQTTKILNLFNNTIEKGNMSAQKFSDSLLIFSQKTGQSANKVFTDFNSNIDRFAVVTADKAIASFQKLQMTAARTGQSVSQVIGAIERFDDIETGFQAGGQLNRVLSFMGGSFDTFKAMQASDEERAQMLYSAIGDVSDKFQALQTDQARRSFAKQLADSSGLDMKTVMGLLSKSTDLSKDIADISKKPIVAEEFTERGREEAAMRATTAEELKKIQGQMVDLNPLIGRLSNEVKENTRAFTGFTVSEFKKMDDKLGTLLARGTRDEFTTAGKDFFTGIKNLPSDFNKYMKEFRTTTKPESDRVISGNTKIISDVTVALNKLNTRPVKVEVTGTITSDGKVKVGGKSKPSTVANALNE